MMTTRAATPSDLPAVRALYAAGGYGGGIADGDRVIVATLEEAVIGAVRLCREDGVTVLRGMQVAPAHQRNGAGRAMLDACVDALGADVAYCLPYAHLVAFYGHAGFRLAGAGELPGFLKIRLAYYSASRQDVVAMIRVPDETHPA